MHMFYIWKFKFKNFRVNSFFKNAIEAFFKGWNLQMRRRWVWVSLITVESFAKFDGVEFNWIDLWPFLHWFESIDIVLSDRLLKTWINLFFGDVLLSGKLIIWKWLNWIKKEFLLGVEHFWMRRTQRQKFINIQILL